MQENTPIDIAWSFAQQLKKPAMVSCIVLSRFTKWATAARAVPGKQHLFSGIK